MDHALQLHARTAVSEHDLLILAVHNVQHSSPPLIPEDLNGLQQAELERAAQEERSRKMAHEEEERKRKAARQQVKLKQSAWLQPHKETMLLARNPEHGLGAPIPAALYAMCTVHRPSRLWCFLQGQLSLQVQLRVFLVADWAKF